MAMIANRIGMMGNRAGSRGHFRGFSTVELMVVIAVLVILIGIAVVSFRTVADRMKGNANEVTLAGLQSAVAEAEQAGLFARPVRGVWAGGAWVTESASIAGRRKIDFWRRPVNLAGLPVPMQSPGVMLDGAAAVSSGWGAGRPFFEVSDLLQNTAVAIATLRTNPGVSEALIRIGGSSSPMPSFYDNRSSYRPRETVVFYLGDDDDEGYRVFTAISDVPAGTTPPLNGDNSFWRRGYGAVLDNFGGPIVFVPATGLQAGIWLHGSDPLRNSKRDFVPGDRVYVTNDNLPPWASGATQTRTYYICQRATTALPGMSAADWRPADPIRSRDGKPFWASGGPDGNLDTVADNVYSFGAP